MAAQILAEPVDVQPQVCGVAHQVNRPQLPLMLQQQVVHGPERALPASGFGRLGTQCCVRVRVGQRQVPLDVSEVAEVGEKCPTTGSAWPQ
jgi:hypothetical protein